MKRSKKQAKSMKKLKKLNKVDDEKLKEAGEKLRKAPENR